MNSFLKKKVAVLLSAVLCISTFSTLGVSAASELDGIISEVGYAYNYVDANDVGTITNAYARAINVTADAVTDAGIDGLMTDAFVAKYDSENEAKAALVSLISTTLSVHYSTSAGAFGTNVYSAEADMAAVLEDIGVSLADWADLMLKTRKDSQDIANGVEKLVWAFGSLSGNTDSLTELYNTMDSLQLKAMKKALALDQYLNAKQALEAISWTPEAILAGVEAVSKVTDPVKAAEFALIKAAARSGTELFVDGNPVSVGTQGVNWEKNIYRISPDDLPITKTLKIEVIGDERATNAAGYYVSDDEMVTVTRNRTDYELDFTINDVKKGVVDIIIKRDPYGDNNGSNDDWLLRQKVLVAYDLQSAAKPTWGTDADAGKLSWADVEHAVKYEVVIYKDGEEVAREVVTEAEFDANAVMAANGNGSYTAGVIAMGDIEQEVAAESAKSDPHNYTSALGTPDAPIWTDKTLSWDEVTGATSYIVYLYRGASTDPFETITVASGTTCDVSSVLAGMEGTFYAAVKAKNETSTSALSAKSLPLVLVNTFKVTGKATLQSLDISDPENENVVQPDNSGIKVSILELSSLGEVATTADGSYTLTDVPNGTYTVVFQHPTRPFLKKHVAATVTNGDVSVNTMLYYGDTIALGGTQINLFDIGPMLPLLGSSSGDAGFDATKDIDNDGAINAIEIYAILRNYGKKPTSL